MNDDSPVPILKRKGGEPLQEREQIRKIDIPIDLQFTNTLDKQDKENLKDFCMKTVIIGGEEYEQGVGLDYIFEEDPKEGLGILAQYGNDMQIVKAIHADTKQIVGYLFYRTVYSEAKQYSTAELDLICTRQAPRGDRGYGKFILRRLTKFLKQYGIRELRIIGISTAVFYYIKLGFQFTDAKYQVRDPQPTYIFDKVMQETVSEKLKENVKLSKRNIWRLILEKFKEVVAVKEKTTSQKRDLFSTLTMSITYFKEKASTHKWVLAAKTARYKRLREEIWDQLIDSYKARDVGFYMTFLIQEQNIPIRGFCDICYEDNPGFIDTNTGFSMCSQQCLNEYIEMHE